MLALLSLALSLCATTIAGPFVVHDELGAAYPYAVHLPDGANPPSNAPLSIFLHGMGSVGSVDEIQEKVSSSLCPITGRLLLGSLRTPLAGHLERHRS
jgi:hypothetical protein